MQMEVPVGVDVIERQASRTKGEELRLDLGAHLIPRLLARCEPEGKPDEVRTKTPASVHKTGNFLPRQRRVGVRKREMEAHAQARQPESPLDGVLRKGRRHHETRGREDAPRASELDRLVHFAGEAEIVRGDDETVQIGSPLRSRRNEKNSTPSRSLRASIWRLFAISATIAAIFEARK